MIFICYKKCSTCRGIQKILEEKRLHYSCLLYTSDAADDIL